MIDEGILKINRKTVDSWKTDLRRLTKIYRSIEHDTDDKVIVKIRHAFHTFRDNFEDFVYKSLLPKEKRDNVESFETVSVRRNAWTAILSFSGLFPDTWRFTRSMNTFDHVELLKNRESNIRAYNRAYKIAIDSIIEFIDQAGTDKEIVRAEPYKTTHIDGMTVIIDSWSDTGDDYSATEVDKFLSNLSKMNKQIKSAGFGGAIAGGVVRINFNFTGQGGSAAGTYNFNDDEIAIYVSGLSAPTYIHEVGHRFYYKRLPSNAVNYWNDMIEGAKLEITEEYINEFVNKYVNYDDIGGISFTKQHIIGIRKVSNVIKKDKKLDPHTKAVFLAIANSPGVVSINTNDMDTLYKKINRVKGNYIPIEHITDYAKENPIEAYAEAFKLYVDKGQSKLKPWTRWLFEEVSRTGGAKIR